MPDPTVNWLERRPRFAPPNTKQIIPIRVLDADAEFPLDPLEDAQRAYATVSGWKPVAGRHLVIRNGSGFPTSVLFAIERRDWWETGVPFVFGGLPVALRGVLPASNAHSSAFQIEGIKEKDQREAAALGWLLGSYSHRPDNVDDQTSGPFPLLVPPAEVDTERILVLAEGSWLARRLVDAPANHLGPNALHSAAEDIARLHGASCSGIVGEQLVRSNWPLVYAVGSAGSESPRVVDIRWGADDADKVTLVGKGVTFDSGGLDIKPSRAMRLMKKDMGGAAAALALAHMIMSRNLPVRLRVLLPIAENAISANSFRPGDVLRSRKGMEVEIGDTDAEGRLLLADALTEADSESPSFLFDFATLTGAARVALGADLPALFATDDGLASGIEGSSRLARDPVWRLPLWEPYAETLKSKIADIANTGPGGLGGAITAALFLSRFIENREAWAHFDIFAWTSHASPGRPVGGECQAARAIFHFIESRIGAA